MIRLKSRASVALGGGKARVSSQVVGEAVSVNARSMQLLYFLELFSTQPELVACQGQIPDKISFFWTGDSENGYWTATSEAVVAQGDDVR